MTVRRLADGRVIVNDFVDGGRIIQPRRTRRMTDEDAMAQALWLSNHGRLEEAEELLDRYVQSDSLLIRH
jgi:hypothetical protein